MTVFLQKDMHLASTFLGEHSAHRIEGTLSSMHVIIHDRGFMCMRSHVGYTPLISLERRQSKTVGYQVVELNVSKQKIDIPLVVAEDAVSRQALKDGLVAALRQAVASRAVGRRLLCLNFETKTRPR